MTIDDTFGNSSFAYLGREQCCTLSWAPAPPPLWRVIVWPDTSRLDTPPCGSSSQGGGKDDEAEKELEELEKTRLAWEVEKEGEPWNWEVGVSLPLAVLLSSFWTTGHNRRNGSFISSPCLNLCPR